MRDNTDRYDDIKYHQWVNNHVACVDTHDDEIGRLTTADLQYVKGVSPPDEAYKSIRQSK